MTDPFTLSRRSALGMMGTAAGASMLPATAAAATASGMPGATWHSTSATAPWQSRAVPALAAAAPTMFAQDATIQLDKPRQTMAGFGGAFSERGWDALTLLSPAKRQAALAALFTAQGCNFSQCRTPIGADDFSRDWYSYDETPGDFALDHFSVARDRETLIPFIKAAQALRPDLKIWASPWSPPSWMKKGGHYAQAPAWPGAASNGIKPDQLGHEGADSFIQEDRYFAAYAAYFARYVQAYAGEGIAISTVMPQNEFNSAQPFPSCCWTPQGLARFLPHLGRAMGPLGVSVFLGTLERGNADLVSQVMADPQAASVVKGLGVQWAGKTALPVIRDRFPDIALWGTEQECGIGTNDWHYARYGWETIRQYFAAGASAWTYWNMVMPTGGMSGWGWPQNSMIVVDPVKRDFTLTPDYWLMRHLAGSVQAGARAIPVDSFLGFNDQLAFRNPDGTLVLVANNGLGQAQQVRYGIGKRVLTLDLPADSLNTLVLPAAMLEV
ncbi:glycoside hydrolase family 30 protein [Novosphingobium rosa]|uniref:glycoside hydrolase family 30 protein n=1 Tax=Novosphingobium rosa TaxID=76978 RepID=UPI000AB2807A|nr:glycoside hydrolase family 30 beta sandwich domain-containing protein [Novosphingobium rosa]